MISVILCALLLTGCAAQPAEEIPVQSAEAAEALLFRISNNDRLEAAEDVQQIDLDALDRDLCITEGGAYRLTGSLRGTVYVDAQDENVHIILAEAKIEGRGAPAIYALSAGKLFITAEAGTENQLADTGAYDSGVDAEACLFASCDLTINGGGELSVTGLFKDAVRSKDVLKVIAADITVRAKRDGLRGNDGVLVMCEKIRIESEGNAIRTTKFGEENRGAVEIIGSDISIIAGEYGVNAAGHLNIHHAGCRIKGVLGRYSAGGTVSVAEGNLADE